MNTDIANDPDLLTQKEAAKFLRITVETLRKWRREGKLSFFRIHHKCIRIPRSQVQRILDEAHVERKA